VLSNGFDVLNPNIKIFLLLVEGEIIKHIILIVFGKIWQTRMMSSLTSLFNHTSCQIIQSHKSQNRHQHIVYTIIWFIIDSYFITNGCQAIFASKIYFWEINKSVSVSIEIQRQKSAIRLFGIDDLSLSKC